MVEGEMIVAKQRIPNMELPAETFTTSTPTSRKPRIRSESGFTATQIPDIEGRRYPAELAGEGYPEGIPIYSEEEPPELIKRLGVDRWSSPTAT